MSDPIEYLDLDDLVDLARTLSECRRLWSCCG